MNIDSISIELFAAFLDGTMSESDMHQFSQLVEHNNVLHQLLDASSVVDNTIAGFTDIELQLPIEITVPSFELPVSPNNDLSQLVNLSPEPMYDIPIAACACDDISISPSEQFDNSASLGYEYSSNPSHLMSESDNINSGDDVSGTLADNL